MKKLLFMLLVSMALYSCSSSESEYVPPTKPNYLVKISAVAFDENNASDVKIIKDALKAIGCNEDGQILVADRNSDDKVKNLVQGACSSINNSLTKGFYSISIIALKDSKLSESDSNFKENSVEEAIFKTVVGKIPDTSSVHAWEFYDNENVQYATDILTCTGNPYNGNGYHGLDKDLNDGAGGDYIYMSVKFEAYDPAHKNDYITDVICVDSKSSRGQDYTIKYNGRTYHMPSTYCDLNSGAGGHYLYIMYTKEPYDNKYLVNQAETGYVYRYGARGYTPSGTSNTTRLVYTYSGGSTESFSVKEQNYGSYDRVVPRISTDGSLIDGQGDFNATCGGEFMYMVGAYDTAPTAPYYKWMSAISDGTRITAMSIPASHDSYTYNMASGSGVWSQDQMCNTQEQWNHGIRGFDIRLHNDLSGAHGSASCYDDNGDKIYYGAMLSELKKFVTNNPTETAIALISHEDYNFFEEGVSDDFRYNSRHYADSILGDKAIPFSPELTMGQARGKIIVIFGDEYKDDAKTTEDKVGPFGTLCTSFPKDGYATYYSVLDKKCVTYADGILSQNKWELEEEKVHDKVDLFIKKSDEYDSKSLDYWCKNHTAGYWSGSLYSVHSCDFAEQVVPDIYKYIKEKKHRLGLIMVDFAGYNLSKQSDWEESHKTMGNALVRAVIENNFR